MVQVHSKSSFGNWNWFQHEFSEVVSKTSPTSRSYTYTQCKGLKNVFEGANDVIDKMEMLKKVKTGSDYIKTAADYIPKMLTAMKCVQTVFDVTVFMTSMKRIWGIFQSEWMPTIEKSCNDMAANFTKKTCIAQVKNLMKLIVAGFVSRYLVPMVMEQIQGIFVKFVMGPINYLVRETVYKATLTPLYSAVANLVGFIYGKVLRWIMELIPDLICMLNPAVKASQKLLKWIGGKLYGKVIDTFSDAIEEKTLERVKKFFAPYTFEKAKPVWRSIFMALYCTFLDASIAAFLAILANKALDYALSGQKEDIMKRCNQMMNELLQSSQPVSAL